MNESQIFAAALKLTTPAERAAYLDGACAGDPKLRAGVDALLQVQAQDPAFLEQPAVPIGKTVDQVPASGMSSEIDQLTQPGAVLAGRYKLAEAIGEGGMGTVWMAQQIEPVKRVVAVKLIKAGMDSKQVLARFEAERQALALMDHPHIAKVLDAGATAAGRPFFVMELVKGVPITRYCDEHRLTPRQRLELFLPVCQAIQHAHQKGIIHRDIKPSNVLVAPYDGKPVPKVIDFGVAKAAGQQLTDRTLLTGFGAIVGTLEYMSPEQAELNNRDIDTRSDIYALGVLLYELLTGSTPLNRQRLKQAAFTEMLRIIREEEPAKPSTRLSDSKDSLPSISAQRQTEPAKLTRLVRGELDWIVMKALEKDRGRRYETANGFAMDVQRYLADEAVLACPPSAGYRLRKFARRNRGPMVASSVVLLSLVVGIIGTTTGLVWAVREREAKAKALVAETEAKETEVKQRQEKEKALASEIKAHAAEKQARDNAMAALRCMTDELVEHQMARGMQLTEKNKEFLRKVIKHYEGFAAVTANDAENKAIRAEGYLRVGLMRSRLGELREAEAAYGDALAILKHLATEFPNRSESCSLLAASYHNLAHLLENTGRLKEAEMAYGAALVQQKQLADEFPARPEFRQNLAKGHLNLGVLFKASGRMKEAAAACDEALALAKQLAADFPTQPEFRHLLAAVHHNLGVLFHETGRLKEAEVAYADALALRRQLAADFPTRLEFRQELARSHDSLGVLLKESGRLNAAEAAYSVALALRKQLAADFPSRPEFRHELAESHNNLGGLFYASRQTKEAEATFADAIMLQKQLAADFPARPEFRQDLAASHNNLGSVLANAGRLNEAKAAFNHAFTLRKQLAADFPNRPDLCHDLAGTCSCLGLLHLHLRDFENAKATLEKGVPHHESALKLNPQNPNYRGAYLNTLGLLIDANARLGNTTAAKQIADKLSGLEWNPHGNTYRAARGLAFCMSIVQQGDQSTKEVRDKQAAFYAAEAMRLLRDAVAKGYKNTVRMKNDRHLDLLRNRMDFKNMLAEMELKQKESQLKSPQPR